VKKFFLLLSALLFSVACGGGNTESKAHEYVEIPDVNLQNWSINPQQYEFVMTMTAIVTVDGQTLDSLNNLLAVFSGSELRGVATPYSHLGEAVFDLMIYSNALDETLNFGLWIDELGKAVEISNELQFVSGEALGSPDTPYILTVK
jgi:hypothetical protein